MDNFQTFQEAQSAWHADSERLKSLGILFQPGAEPKSYMPDEFRRDYTLAMDALPVLSTDPNSGLPALLTTFIDPQIYRILFAPLAAVEIYGEMRRGDWTMDTTMFPIVEHTGEVTSYGDYATGGRAGVNANWPQVQSYIFQTVKEYGERELDRMGLGRLNWVSEIDRAAATIMSRAMNTIYHFGLSGLQNYGLLNNPYLSAALTPSTKTAGGVTRFNLAGGPNALSTEVYNDIVALVQTLFDQTGGLAAADDKMVLVLPTTVATAINFVNSFNVSTMTLLKEQFPKLRVVKDVLFGVKSSTNPTGVAGGNLVQLIAEEIDGQKTGFCAFNEKMRAHPIIRHESSFRQKVTGGAWGTVIRQPMAVAQMLGV